MDMGTPSRLQMVSSHRRFRISYSMVRLALVQSVTWTFPPVSFQISQLSTVPKSSFPSSARSRAPGTLSKIHLILVAEK